MLYYWFNVITFTIMAFAVFYIIEKELHRFYLIVSILTVIFTFISSYFIYNGLGGIIPAVIPAILLYKKYSNKIYAACMFYAIYTSYYIADLILGIIYTNILKINLVEYLSGGINRYIFMLIIFVITLLFGFLYSKVLKRLKIKIMWLPNKRENTLSIRICLAVIMLMLITIYTKKSGISADAINIVSIITLVIEFIIIYYWLFTSKCYYEEKQKELDDKLQLIRASDDKEKDIMLESLSSQIKNKKLVEYIKEQLKSEDKEEHKE